jgi:hypothetical protein
MLGDADWATAVTLDFVSDAAVGSATADHAARGGWRRPMG